MAGTNEPVEFSLPPMRRLTITVPDELVAGLEDVAEALDGSISEAVREAVGTYLMEHYWTKIGDHMKKGIRDGLTNKQLLESVIDLSPTAPITPRSISWYRSHLIRTEGPETIPTDASVRRLEQAFE